MKIPESFMLYGQRIKVSWNDKLCEETGFRGISNYRKNEIELVSNTGPYSKVPRCKVEQVFCCQLVNFLFTFAKVDSSEEERQTVSRLIHQYFETRKYKDNIISGDFYLYGEKIYVCQDFNLEEDESARGMAYFRRNVISILPSIGPYKDFSQPLIEQVFCHELLHFIFRFSGLDDKISEKEVDIMGFLLHQFLITCEGDLWSSLFP
jgi:hypothetical protein